MTPAHRLRFVAAVLVVVGGSGVAGAQTADPADRRPNARIDQPSQADVDRADTTGSAGRNARSSRDDGYEPGSEGGRTIRCPDGSIGKTEAGGCLGDPQPRLTR